MREAKYNVVGRERGWGISHDGSVNGDYLTTEAAFEAAVAAASNAIKDGYAVTITVEGSNNDEPALGARREKYRSADAGRQVTLRLGSNRVTPQLFAPRSGGAVMSALGQKQTFALQ